MPKDTSSSSEKPSLEKIAMLSALEDLKAQAVSILDVRSLTNIANTMLIATATSNRHAKALAQQVCESIKVHGYAILGIEGEKEGEWVLVDAGDVIVHIMLATTRNYYNLEQLWQVELSEV